MAWIGVNDNFFSLPLKSNIFLSPFSNQELKDNENRVWDKN